MKLLAIWSGLLSFHTVHKSLALMALPGTLTDQKSCLNAVHSISHKNIVGRINVHFGQSLWPFGVDCSLLCRAQATFILHLRMNAKSIPASISLCLLPLCLIGTSNVVWDDTYNLAAHFPGHSSELAVFIQKFLKENRILLHYLRRLFVTKGNYLCCHPRHKHLYLLYVMMVES